ncbi:protein POLYCHOME-like [Impatiens glandulifera]|uniref:protein POLYCHOME-like n=1 Tax=Impatiens glandulifera TaxID=253017 RepID=UPI001FB0CDB6|nr:protein POLYCHOME-like [Impatiens glandulifera]
MPESRDRLARPVDVAAIFAQRRASIVNRDIFLDEPEVGSGSVTGRGGTLAPRRGGVGGVGVGRLNFRSPRMIRGRYFNNSPIVGQENYPSGRGGIQHRRRGSSAPTVLPSWYPRTPLRDITSIVRAIERRRIRLREAEASNESPQQVDQNAAAPSLAVSGVQLEHNNTCLITPNLMAGMKKKPNNSIFFSTGKIPMILNDSCNESNADTSNFITPQKKLMNSIDTVGKAMMEELEKLKKTPTAKKAERAKKIRTLMSMR